METILSFCTEHDDFRDRWRLIYNIDMPRMLEVRIKCANLLQHDEEWRNFEQLIKSSLSSSSVKTYSIYIFNKIVDDIGKSAINDSPVVGLMDDVLLNDVKTEYGSDPLNFCVRLAKCLDQEKDLIDNYQKMDQEVDSTITLMDTVREVENLKKRIDDDIANLDELIVTEDECKESLKEHMVKFKKVQNINGTSQAAKEEIEKKHKQLGQVQKKIQDTKLKVKTLLECLILKTTEALDVLKEKIEVYQKKLQMHYVDLESKPTIPIEAENGFSTLGKVLHDLLSYSMEKLQAICDSFIPEEIVARVKEKFRDLLQSSFIVTEQVHHVIKVELGSKKRNKEGSQNGCEGTGQKFKCPTFKATVRLLAGKLIENKSNVKAQFCQEDEVNRKFSTKHWDSPCEFKLKPRVDEAPFDKKKDSASFTRMELERFERKQDKQVCEDKFRIVFSTRVKIHEKEFDLVTISLPVVVTTGASQGCNVHGSLLWQCYSTPDIFSVPIEPVVSLPWGKLFQMLDMKYKTLGGRSLREDEKSHLGKRLVQDEVLTDESEVPFRKFCVDKMMDIKENDEKKKSATFWMWFLAVFNLIKNHLKEYWNENLIYGFVSRENAEKKLGELMNEHLNMLKPYTYMLRFSEKIITDGQGQNLCGAISAACIYQTSRGIKFAHTIPFKAETFKKKTLAQCVKNTMGKNSDMPPVPLLRWIYPGDKSTDDAFQSFSAQSRSSCNTGYDEWEEVMITKIRDLHLESEDGNSQRPIKTAKRHRNTKSTHSSKQSKSRKPAQNESDVEMLQVDSSSLQGSLSPYDRQAPSIPSTVHDFDSDSQTSFSESVSSSCLNDIPSVASNASVDATFAGSKLCPTNPAFKSPQTEPEGNLFQQFAQQVNFSQQQSVSECPLNEAFPTLTKLLHNRPNIKEDFSDSVTNTVGQQQNTEFELLDENVMVFEQNNSCLQIPPMDAGNTMNPQQQLVSTSNLMEQMEQLRQLQCKLDPQNDMSQNTVPPFDLASHGLAISNSLPLKTENDFSCANSVMTDNNVILDISQNDNFQSVIFTEQKKEEGIGSYEEVITIDGSVPDPQDYINDMMARRESDPLRVEFLQTIQTLFSSLQNVGNFRTERFPDTPVSNISQEDNVNSQDSGSDFNVDSNSNGGV